jgi:hypothetical protein
VVQHASSLAAAADDDAVLVGQDGADIHVDAVVVMDVQHDSVLQLAAHAACQDELEQEEDLYYYASFVVVVVVAAAVAHNRAWHRHMPPCLHRSP